MIRENPQRILVADDDDIARRMIEALMGQAGYEVLSARDGEEAWAIAQREGAPRIMLLDWMMPVLEGVELCRRVRQREGAPRPYIVLVTAKSRRRDVLAGLEAGADDFITKPYAPEELLARIRVAERVLSTGSTSSGIVLAALNEALSSPGGEVVVRREEAVGRIFVHEGRIAWAHVSTEPGALYELIEPEMAVSKDDLRGVVEECRKTRKSFTEVLIERGLTDRARHRERLQRWIERKLDAILHMPHPMVTFVPEARAYARDLTFALDEVLVRPPPPEPSAAGEAVARLASTPASVQASHGAALRSSPELLPGLSSKLDAALRIEGAAAAALLELSTGRCLERRGEPVDLDLALGHLKLMRALPAGESMEEVLLTSSSRFHITRPLRGSPDHFIYVALRRADATMAMARLQLAAITGQRRG
jgi:CheY-like chemotaxis protein